MNTEELVKEQRVLSQMQKTLKSIVNEISPPAGDANSLSSGTIEEIKYCFAVISGREKELSDRLGIDRDIPHYEDRELSNALSFVKLPRRPAQYS
jgi:hypothetical protein